MSTVWPILHYDDTRAALRFLVEVFGFEEVVTATDDQKDVVHAELRWPGGGSLVFGSTKHTDGVHGSMKPGAAAVYIVTQDVDDVHDRVCGSDVGTVVVAPAATQFGSGDAAYAFTAADPEGNLWTFGSYPGASPRE